MLRKRRGTTPIPCGSIAYPAGTGQHSFLNSLRCNSDPTDCVPLERSLEKKNMVIEHRMRRLTIPSRAGIRKLSAHAAGKDISSHTRPRIKMFQAHDNSIEENQYQDQRIEQRRCPGSARLQRQQHGPVPLSIRGATPVRPGRVRARALWAVQLHHTRASASPRHARHAWKARMEGTHARPVRQRGCTADAHARPCKLTQRRVASGSC